MTMTVLIAALFAAGAVFAAGTIVATLRAYWPAVCALREAADYGAEEQELRVTTIGFDVSHAAKVLRPDFRTRSVGTPRGLRAAA